MEPLALITSIITICNTVRDISKEWKDARDLPEAFRVIHDQVPVINEILATAKTLYRRGKSEDSSEIRTVLEPCYENAEKLQLLFEKVCPEGKPNRLERYKRTLDDVFHSRAEKVEKIWVNMLRSIQLLDNYHTFKSLEANSKVQKVLEEMQGIADSLAEPNGTRMNIGTISGGQGLTFFAGDGNENYAATGQGGHAARHMAFYAAPTAVQNYNYYNRPTAADGVADMYTDCLQALYITNPQSNMDRAIARFGRRTDGSCEWFLANDEYVAWHSAETARLLLVTGEPGVGKTVIATFIVEQLRTELESPGGATVLSYFCNDIDPQQRTACAIMRGLLFQAFDKKAAEPSILKHVYDVEGHKLFRDFYQLSRLLVQVLASDRRRKILIIDALDEYDTATQREILSGFSQLHEEILHKQHDIKVLLFARPTTLIETKLKECADFRTFRIEPSMIKKDLRLFINDRVTRISRDWAPSLCQQVRDLLMEKNGGTFLWVSIVLDIIAEVDQYEVIREIGRVPHGLTDTYNTLLGKIKSENIAKACLVLHFVLIADQPLTTTQLGLLLFFCEPETGRRRSLPTVEELKPYQKAYSACGTLVRVEKNSSGILTLVPIHLTIKEFLSGKDLDERYSRFRYRDKDVLKTFVKATVAMFRVPQLMQITKHMRKVFRACAGREWSRSMPTFNRTAILKKQRFVGLNARQPSFTPENFSGDVPDFVWDAWKLFPYTLMDSARSWLQAKTVLRWFSVWGIHAMALIMLSDSYLEEYSRWIGNKGVRNLRRIYGPTLDSIRKTTHVAVERGNLPVVLILLNFAERVSIKDDASWISYVWALLVEAIVAGRPGIAKGLVEQTRFFSIVPKERLQFNRVHGFGSDDKAAAVGLTVAHIIKQAPDLVSMSASPIHSQVDTTEKALRRTAQQIMAFVFDKTGPNQEQGDAWKALIGACLSHFAREGSETSTMLYCAAAVGTVEVLEYCLEAHGSDPSAQDGNGKTALHYAALGGHTDTVQALIELQTETLKPDAPGLSLVKKPPWYIADLKGNLPLHYGAASGSDSTVEALLRADPSRYACGCLNQDGKRPIELAKLSFRDWQMFRSSHLAMAVLREKRWEESRREFQKIVSAKELGSRKIVERLEHVAEHEKNEGLQG